MFTLGSMLGVAAGIATAFSWSLSSFIHASLARVLGVHGFMMFRQPLAAVILFFLCIFFGQFSQHTHYIWAMAVLSGMLGIGISDWFAYECIGRIGLRAGVVFTSLSTCMTALMAVIFLGEELGIQGMLGVMFATVGVIWVVRAEKCRSQEQQMQSLSPKEYLLGVGMGLLAALFLALSFVMSKEALNASMSPLLLTFIRNLGASILLWGMALRLHKVRSSLESVKAHPELVKYFLLGNLVGPVGGIWISSVALEYAGATVGATLIGLQPITTQLLTGIMERRMPPVGGMVGSVVACAGAAILILR